MKNFHKTTIILTFDPPGLLVVFISLVWSTDVNRAVAGETRLVEPNATEKNTNEQKFSILLEKLQQTKEKTKFETISASRSLGMLEGLLDRIMKILREPARKYQKNQTYHGLHLIC